MNTSIPDGYKVTYRRQQMQ